MVHIFFFFTLESLLMLHFKTVISYNFFLSLKACCMNIVLLGDWNTSDLFLLLGHIQGHDAIQDRMVEEHNKHRDANGAGPLELDKKVGLGTYF